MQTQQVFVGASVLTAIIFGFAALIVSPAFAQTDDYGTSTTSGTYCPQLSQTVVRGSSGNQVLELQKFLSDYYDILPATIQTGYFGRITQGYVIQFQKEQGLPSYGIAGSMTRAAIARVCGGNIGGGGGSANFSATPTLGPAPLSVHFKIVTGYEKSYRIDFGDGVRGTAIAPNADGSVTASYMYTSAGSYMATLLETNNLADCNPSAPYGKWGPCVTDVGAVKIGVTAQSVDLRLSLSSGNFAIFTAPLTSSDSPSNYELEFGDGDKALMILNGSSCTVEGNCAPSLPTSMYQAHQYSKQGTFTAKLKNRTMSCASVDCNVISTVTVVVGTPTPPPSSSVY